MENLFRRLSFHYWYYGQPPWDTGVSPPELFEFIQRHPPGRAIDIGCGTGTNVVTLAQAGWQVTGVDFAPRAISLAKKKMKTTGVDAIVQVNDATTLRGINGPFDLVFDLGCFHSIPPTGQIRYLGQLERVLSPDGFWLMYGFLKAESALPQPGLTAVDIDRISFRMSLCSRRDGHDSSRGRSSAWFLFQKKSLQ